MRSFVPACSISSETMPRSATLSMSSRISLKFKCSALSNQLVAQRVLRLGELESRAAVIPIRPHHQKHEVLRRDRRQERDVLLRDERELQHLSGIQLRVRANGLDESAELRAENVERNVSVVDRLNSDAIEADETDGERSFDTVANAGQRLFKHCSPRGVQLSAASSRAPRLSRACLMPARARAQEEEDSARRVCRARRRSPDRAAESIRRCGE